MEAYALSAGIRKVDAMFTHGGRIVLETDHFNLTTCDMLHSPDINIRRWGAAIREHNYVLLFISGDFNPAEAPSRLARPSAEAQALIDFADATASPAVRSISATSSDSDALDDHVDDVVIPGHHSLDPFLRTVAALQAAAPEAERLRWTGTGYSTVTHASTTITLFRGRALLPQGAEAEKKCIINVAHDQRHHMGVDNTLYAIRNIGHIHWAGIDKEVREYIASCSPCQHAESSNSASTTGSVIPSFPPWPLHTIMGDCKGPMRDGNHILLFIDIFTRYCWAYITPQADADTIPSSTSSRTGFAPTPPRRRYSAQTTGRTSRTRR